MTIATETPGGTITLHWPLNDEQFTKLCVLNPEMHFEYTHTGDLIIMAGAGPWTGRTNARLTRLLDVWAEQEGHGFVCDSSTIFTLPSGAKRSPDVSWVRHERWEALTHEEQRGFSPLCPDFVLELRSSSDSLPTLQEKMAECLDNGTRLGWLIDPFERVVYIYRPGEAVERLDDPREVSGEPILAGFVLRLRDIW
jgi:Uma2 family endonuclease